MVVSEDLVSAMIADSLAIAAPLVETYAGGNRHLQVRIERPGSGRSFNRATGTWNGAEPEVVYTGPARFWPVTASRTFGSDEGETETLAGTMSIDRAERRPQQADDVIVVADDTGQLIDARFVVESVSSTGAFAYGWHLAVTGTGPSPNDPS